MNVVSCPTCGKPMDRLGPVDSFAGAWAHRPLDGALYYLYQCSGYVLQTDGSVKECGMQIKRKLDGAPTSDTRWSNITVAKEAE